MCLAIKSAHLSSPDRSTKADQEEYRWDRRTFGGVTTDMPLLQLLDFSDVRQVYGLAALAGAAVFYLNFTRSGVRR